MANPTPKEGIGVDSMGNPTVDPSENVKALSEAANKRQDDLREANDKLFKSKIKCANELTELRASHTKEIAEIRDQHAREMRVSEAARLDSIRQVDVTAVRTEATRALEAIQTLTATSARDAETLRTALVNTAATIASQTADTVKQITERIAALERSNYEGVGKQRLADPQMAELAAEMKALRGTKSEGIDKTWGIVGILATLIVAISGVSIAFVVSGRSPAPIYLSAPPTNIPPQNGPR